MSDEGLYTRNITVVKQIKYDSRVSFLLEVQHRATAELINNVKNFGNQVQDIITAITVISASLNYNKMWFSMRSLLSNGNNGYRVPL